MLIDDGERARQALSQLVIHEPSPPCGVARVVGEESGLGPANAKLKPIYDLSRRAKPALGLITYPIHACSR
jgi:hypothetical protein